MAEHTHRNTRRSFPDSCPACAEYSVDNSREQTRLMTTYSMADGSLVAGEYSYVSDLEYFEDDDEPNHLIVEVWALVSSKELTVFPSGWVHDPCPNCGEEAEGHTPLEAKRCENEEALHG